MLLVTSAAEADSRAKTIDVLGESYVLRGYMGHAPKRGTYVEGNEANDNPLPQGFLVDQPAGAITHPHFHESDQFQVFVAGDGYFGKKPARPLTVQYANGHTPYGPIVAGEHGIRYFTLRKRWDPGAKYMPKMRDKLVRGRQRQFLAPEVPLSDQDTLKARRDSSLDVFIGPEDDGLLGAILRLGPNQSARAPDAGAGDGQYMLVVNGSLRHADQLLPVLSCEYAYADEGSPLVQAGPDGLELLILRFGPDRY
ncbi:MAG: hypothetical protein KDK91_27395 [Gammaproteobacteria bacterium]|nr:hypothetical protein [Gammaproteobacteria bacterium]